MKHSGIAVVRLAIGIFFVVSHTNLSFAFHTAPPQFPKSRDTSSSRKDPLVLCISSDGSAEMASSYRDIQYHYYGAPTASNQTAVLFCNGFRSSMNGIKARFLEEHCKQRDISFCRFDYRGHGLSNPEKFLDWTLSDWIQDATDILLNVLEAHDRVIVVGSSMGAWIACHVAQRHPKKVAGIVGVASGIDFTESIFECASDKQRNEWKATGVTQFPSQYEEGPYPISWKLIQDAKEKWLLLDKSSIPIICPVRLLHGQQDEDVSWRVSIKLSEAMESQNVVLTLVKDGDHRLSRPQDLERMVACLDELLARVDVNEMETR